MRYHAPVKVLAKNSTCLTRHQGISDHVAADTIRIVLLRSTSSKKNRFHRIVHAPSRTTLRFGEVDLCASRTTGLPTDVISDVIPTTAALADVTCLRQCHLIRWRHHLSTCWRHPLTFFWRLTLTRTGLLLVAIIVTDNPANVFAIFANVLVTILRLAIIATNQLFQFLLLLLLTLRVSNQWLPSLHSLSLAVAFSPFPQMTLKTSSPMSFVWLVMHLIPLFFQLYLVCLLPLGLWIPLVAITWHLTRPYFLNLNLHHTLLIFAQQMVPQCLVII